MKIFSKRLLVSTIAAGLLLPAVSYATNGYFLIGYGATSRAMGGVGVAVGQDGLAAAFNPATMSDVADTITDSYEYGTRFDIGADLFKPKAAIFHDDNNLLGVAHHDEPDSPSTAFSKNGYYLLPAMGWVTKINNELAWGFAMIGSGAAAEYDQSLPDGEQSYFFNYNGLGGDKLAVKLMNLQMLPSISYKIDDKNSVGATLVISYQLFEANGLGAFETLGFGATSGNLTDNDTDTSWGGGIRLGWKGKFMEDKLHIGVNYSSRTYMQEFDKYKNLFAEQGDFDIPSSYAIGLAFEVNPEITTYLDIQRINFSEVASVGNAGPQLTGSFFECGDISCGALGQDKGLGFGWEDQTVIKLGVEYMYSPEITLRAGYNHADAQIPEDQVLFSLLAPATIEDHLSLGATYQWDEDIEISMSYVHAFENTITGPTPFQPVGADPANPVDNASIAMEQNSVSATLGIKF